MRKIFEYEGVLIEDDSSYYYMPMAIDGKKDVMKVKNRAYKETYDFWRFKEKIKGKKVRVVVFELDEEENKTVRGDFAVRQYGKDLLAFMDGQYVTTTNIVNIDVGDVKVTIQNNDGQVKVVFKRKGKKVYPKICYGDDGAVAYVKL